jgi:anti-sigma factor RsiW
MKTRIGKTDVSMEDLQLYYDGELPGAEAQELANRIEADPDLKAELERMSFFRDLVSAGLEERAAQIPEARFEQIWDEVERSAIELDAQKRGLVEPISFWSRVSTMTRPLWIPLGAAGLAAAVTLMAVRGIQPLDHEQDSGTVASESAQSPTDREEATPRVVPDSGALAQAESMPSGSGDLGKESASLPPPTLGHAEVKGVDFAGGRGQINQSGTVTVFIVEEVVEQEQSERSL